MDDLGLPYKNPTRQVQGRITEKKVARELGARLHPNSGSGRIKEDASDEEHLFEIKDANKSFALNSADLMQSFVRATRQGKDAVWYIRFTNGIDAEIRLTRGRR